MVDELDINTNATISKYFWKKSMNGNINMVSGEKSYTIVFFEALPDDFYDLIEDSGASEGKVKSSLDSVTGCKILKQHNQSHTDVTKSFYGYPIYRNAGEDGFYVVMYDKESGVTITDPLIDIVNKGINVRIPLEGDDEYIIRGFLIKDSNDYLICYSDFTNPTYVEKFLVFNKMSTIIDVGAKSGV